MYRGAGDVVRDYSGENNHGEIHGAKWTDERSAAWALSFDGDYVDITTIPTFSAYTILCWSYHRSVGDGDLDVDIGLTQENHIVMRDDGGSSYEFMQHSADGVWYTVATAPIANDEWNLWGQTWDGATVTGWKNAEIVGSGDVATMETTKNGGDALGTYPAAAGQDLDGILGMVMFFGRVLSESEITDIYEETKPLYVG